MSFASQAPASTPGTAGSAGWNPLDTLQLDALVSACALVAYADGWVTVEERKSASARMQRVDATTVFGVERCLMAFDVLIRQFEQDSIAATERAEAAILKLAGKPELGRLVVESACRVAVADGGLDRAEREAILDVCQLLNLDPAPFGVIAPDGRR